jgi:hypothetical protein
MYPQYNNNLKNNKIEEKHAKKKYITKNSKVK